MRLAPLAGVKERGWPSGGGNSRAWLNSDPANLQALYAIFDDKRHPFYEHKIAA